MSRSLAFLAFLVVGTGGATAQDTVTVLRGARILPVSGPAIENGTVVLAQGRIRAVGGADLEVPEGSTTVDCRDKVITPGLVDAATELGLKADDRNEQGEEVTPQVRVLDALEPDDPGLQRALRGGVTTVQVNPGDRNVIGGLGAVIKTSGDTIADMLMRDESGLTLTLGDEPTSGNRAIRGGTPASMYDRRPTTRMGVIWETRKAFYDAKAYGERKTDGSDAGGNASLDVLLRALKGELLVHTTARAEQDIRTALRLANEFGYKTLVEDATEAWECPDELAAAGVSVLVTSPSGAAREQDGAERRYHTLNLLAARGVPFAICTGGDERALPLVQEAMFAVRYGLDPAAALDAVTRRPAEILGVADKVGALAPGLDADLVVWSGDPFDPTSAVEAVYVRGAKVAP